VGARKEKPACAITASVSLSLAAPRRGLPLSYGRFPSDVKGREDVWPASHHGPGHGLGKEGLPRRPSVSISQGRHKGPIDVNPTLKPQSREGKKLDHRSRTGRLFV